MIFLWLVNGLVHDFDFLVSKHSSKFIITYYVAYLSLKVHSYTHKFILFVCIMRSAKHYIEIHFHVRKCFAADALSLEVVLPPEVISCTESKRLKVVVYKVDKLFQALFNQTATSSQFVNSWIASAKVGGDRIANLTTKVRLILPHKVQVTPHYFNNVWIHSSTRRSNINISTNYLYGGILELHESLLFSICFSIHKKWTVSYRYFIG